MSRTIRISCILLIFAGTWMFAVVHSHAQSELQLEAVEPPEGYPGQRLTLTLIGKGFPVGDCPSRSCEVQVVIGGFDVTNVRIENDERIVLEASIPEEAPPGPRTVELHILFNGRDEAPVFLNDGFFVLQSENPPPNPEPPDQPNSEIKMELHAVEPREGEPARRLTLTLLGSGFPVDCSDCRSEVVIGGLNIRHVQVESSERITVEAQIPGDAPPGPRPVEVHVFVADREVAFARLPSGFMVVEPVNPGRVNKNNNETNLAVIIVVIVVIGLVGIVSAGYFRGRGFSRPEDTPFKASVANRWDFRFEYDTDLGEQSIDNAGKGLKMDIDIRLQTAIDYGEQGIETDGNT